MTTYLLAIVAAGQFTTRIKLKFHFTNAPLIIAFANDNCAIHSVTQE